MAQYQNYLNQSFQQPTNYYPYNQMQLDRMAQLQHFQQSLQPAPMQMMTLGKIVDSIDIVKATDIPMDGNMYYFPKADGTEIYAKQWMSNGQTRILAFKQVESDSQGNLALEQEKINTGAIKEFTEVLESKLDEFYKKIISPTILED